MFNCAIVLFELLAADTQRIGLQKLDEATRARVIAALAGLIILWFAVILLTWWGARYTKRYMRSSDPKRKIGPQATSDAEWVKKPLFAQDDDDAPDGPRRNQPP